MQSECWSSSMHWTRVNATAILLSIAGLARPNLSVAADAAPAQPATFVGAKRCAPCHEREAQQWRTSHHALAMQPADTSTVLGNFNNATFSKDGVVSTFFRRNGQYFVHTDGPDGTLRDYRIAYTFGVDPLQQYLVDFGSGRYQALSIAWDSRPKKEGGQRWFHLYPRERVDFRDVLHWTGPAQNWNFMCAECHSTNLQKNYRLNEDRFDTTWSDVDVACEACHGPGSRHLSWAAAKAGDGDSLRGLVFHLSDAANGVWAFPPGESIARRTPASASHVEVETCGRCHSRRAQLWGDYEYGQPLAQTHRVALLETDLYQPDGQIKDEVYEYGSFLQSKMYAAGVTCSNCHDPHSGSLRIAGNGLCAQCHLPARFDGPQHHFHKSGTAGAQCMSCHMIERRYMVIDGRRDHSFRVPRPDLSEKLGSSNACTDCHSDKPIRWAEDAVAKWYGPSRRQGWHYGEALAAGRNGQPEAETQLMRAVQDAAVPAIARATALSLLPPFLSPRSLAVLQSGAIDADPLVRAAAAESLRALDPPNRVALGVPLLHDAIRTVRVDALGSLLDVPRAALSSEQLADLDRAIGEYRAVQAFNADRADAHTNLAMLESRLGNANAAKAEFTTAIRLQPSFVPASVQFADLYRSLGQEADAERVLRAAAKLVPDSADLCEALGLSLARQKRTPEAIIELAKAAELAPGEPRYAYVYAVALHDAGEPRRSIDVLTQAYQRHRGARDILIALVEYEAQAGNREAAVAWARKLLAVTPDDPQSRQLLEQLDRP